jgi:hypothetical protein
MNATTISYSLLAMLVMTLLFLWMRRLMPQMTGVRTQRMCPACGLITSLKARCLECGVATVSTR